MSCLTEIIGLSRTECDCPVFADKPANYNTSKSGIFLDELEGIELQMNTGADDCARGGIWDRMQRAVENSISQFTADLLSCVQTTYKQRADNWSGVIGTSSFNSAINPGTQYAGVKIIPNNYKASVMYLKKVGVIVNQNAPVTVKVFSNENNGTLVAQYTVNAIANTLTYALISPLPLELPLWSSNVTYIKYYVVMEITGAYLPVNTKKGCGCGGNQTKPYLSWLDFNGTKGTDVSNIDSFVNTEELNGILLDVDVKCKTAEIICSDENPLDYENDGFAKYVAYAIRFKAGQMLLEELYSSSNINRFTLLSGEKAKGYIDYYRSEYNRYISYLCENIEVGSNDCLVCRNSNGLIKGSILV